MNDPDYPPAYWLEGQASAATETLAVLLEVIEQLPLERSEIDDLKEPLLQVGEALSPLLLAQLDPTVGNRDTYLVFRRIRNDLSQKYLWQLKRVVEQAGVEHELPARIAFQIALHFIHEIIEVRNACRNMFEPDSVEIRTSRPDRPSS